ncbi:hypothetical protein QBC47DRAFT_373335 [Echria macrotheca]|uniref:TRI14-like protein n=1 Tax=Echria macrotheca TaxID=438768 RepID=A0AAJ0BMT5_9PEZI|nr:hypothetical protein QBC47DRAFT_373335 [Echria macrotheca]
MATPFFPIPVFALHILLLLTAPLLQITYALPSSRLPHRSLAHPPKDCPPFSGTFNIDYFQLYPENADWDTNSCTVWFGALWNATVAIYDPYTSTMVSLLSFPGTSYTGLDHIGGVAWDSSTGLITILSDPAKQWATAGADLSGDHLIMKYNPNTETLLWTLNITELTHGKYGGFQDVETDRRGNTYIVGTWPGTVLRVDKHGRAVRNWYLPDPMPPTTQKGFSGLAAVPGTEILLSNDGDGHLYRFDMRDDVGKPVHVPIIPPVFYNGTDAVYLPPRYGGKVLLVAVNRVGVQVLRSGDKTWQTAEYLGTIPTPKGSLYDGGVVTAAVQIGYPGSIYMIIDYTDFPWVLGTVAGNRTTFPMPDITDQIEQLLKSG